MRSAAGKGTRQQGRTGQQGFTLVELMITVAIVSILAAIAIPSYDRYVTKSRRSEAQQLMVEINSKQAQYLLDARSYNATIGAGGLNISRSGWTCAATCTNQFYTVTVGSLDNAATPPYYKITAAPLAGTSQASDGDVTLDSTGAKTGTW
jgi:type IV pilus assembly protein PilE